MAINKQPVVILGPTSVPAGATSVAPVIGVSVDVRLLAGGVWTYKITNGASAPTLACTVVLQISHDGSNWVDYQTFSGGVAASTPYSRAVKMERGVMYARLIAYGNTVNPVTVESYLQAEVG